MTDFTAENGATRVIPGSNRFDDKLRFAESDTEPAEMAKDRCCFTLAAFITAAARTTRKTSAPASISLTMFRGCARKRTNIFRCPLEIARTLPVDLLRLMGYRLGAYALGYVDDTRDPIEVVRPDLARNGFRPVLETQESASFLNTQSRASNEKAE